MPRGFFSAWGCCARCGRVVSCRARTTDGAVGTLPYKHKWDSGPGGGWCDGHKYPALHYTESDQEQFVRDIQEAKLRKRR